MIFRVICLLFGHKPDYDFAAKYFVDEDRKNRFAVKGCSRCGELYWFQHSVVCQFPAFTIDELPKIEKGEAIKK